MASSTQALVITLCVSLNLLLGVALCERDAGRVAGGHSAGAFKSPCGTADELSKRTAACLEPIFELIEGRFLPPNGDQDVVINCQRFNTSERCIRGIAKDCLTGLHKTAVSAVASATSRFRRQECKNVKLRARYLEPLRCAITNGPAMKALFDKHTGYMQGIRDLPITPEEKIIKMCCELNELDQRIAEIFDGNCPQSTPAVLGIVHAITDDARSTLCANPKCKGAVDKLKHFKYHPPANFLEPAVQILFQLQI